MVDGGDQREDRGVASAEPGVPNEPGEPRLARGKVVSEQRLRRGQVGFQFGDQLFGRRTAGSAETGQLPQHALDLFAANIKPREVVWEQTVTEPAQQRLALQQGVGKHLPSRCAISFHPVLRSAGPPPSLNLESDDGSLHGRTDLCLRA
ncbi:hypothetical protein ABZ345_44290 [Lentzea sp. NPDC005914]|uniref:hypothetical protein n=1 Tax=Lentzea sp. NPDC005914 TaxID=3154572 RepID=UPI0033F9EDE7